MLTGRQLREARTLLRLKRSRLAEKVAIVTTREITLAEAVDGQPPITMAQAAAIQSFLQAAGVEFISENSGGPGVRLRKVTS